MIHAHTLTHSPSSIQSKAKQSSNSQTRLPNTNTNTHVQTTHILSILRILRPSI
ncbi:hypothetical protein BofuT4_uP157240.1 [Botrytis cinerea T4]|uniref:Uncharacterized protein n=1 Tax=Botryotinia fuckeliana (strain T4) TaxID=999810 RepID=G2YUN0_BOTF4|nr:hypothetical protein BofuT4_uP157240.1 [Botrytis cinerea T4]